MSRGPTHGLSSGRSDRHAAVRRRLGDYSWRPDRGIPLSDALAELLDDLDRRTQASGSKMLIDPLPFSSGVDALDEVLDGGLRRGVVTVNPVVAEDPACYVPNRFDSSRPDAETERAYLMRDL